MGGQGLHTVIRRELFANIYGKGTVEYYLAIRGNSLPDADVFMEFYPGTRKMYWQKSFDQKTGKTTITHDPWALHTNSPELSVLCSHNRLLHPLKFQYLHNIDDVPIHEKWVDRIARQVAAEVPYLANLGEEGEKIAHLYAEDTLDRFLFAEYPELKRECRISRKVGRVFANEYSKLAASFFGVKYISFKRALHLSMVIEEFTQRSNGGFARWYIRAQANKSSSMRRTNRARTYKKALKAIERLPLEHVPDIACDIINVAGEIYPWSDKEVLKAVEAQTQKRVYSNSSGLARIISQNGTQTIKTLSTSAYL